MTAAGVAFIALLTAVCYRGIEVSARLQQVLLVIEVGALAVFAVVALVKAGTGHALPGAAHPSTAWLSPWTGSHSTDVLGTMATSVLGSVRDLVTRGILPMIGGTVLLGAFVLSVKSYWACRQRLLQFPRNRGYLPDRCWFPRRGSDRHGGYRPVPAPVLREGDHHARSGRKEHYAVTSAHLEPAVPATAGRGRGRRAGRRKIAVLEAACRVIADRGADATRFADVAAASGVPVSTLQYYFGSREDLLVAAFRHASSTEIAELEAEVAGIADPWEQLERILVRSLTGYEPDAPDAGRLWIESWHFGIRDPEMRADALRDNTAWRALVAGVVRRGIELGTFSGRYDPGTVATLAVAAADGMGIPLSLGDPEITARGAVHDVLAALRELLRP